MTYSLSNETLLYLIYIIGGAALVGILIGWFVHFIKSNRDLAKYYKKIVNAQRELDEKSKKLSSYENKITELRSRLALQSGELKLVTSRWQSTLAQAKQLPIYLSWVEKVQHLYQKASYDVYDGWTDSINSDKYKQAMGFFPSGVTIVTTIGNDNEKYGFTASAFSSLSLNPPLILVCLADSADCFKAFNEGNQFAVNIVGNTHEDLALKFATKGADKFGGNEFRAGVSGLPILGTAPVSLECKTRHIYPGGDHIILVGQVEYIEINDKAPTVFREGKFHRITKTTPEENGTMAQRIENIEHELKVVADQMHSN